MLIDICDSCSINHFQNYTNILLLQALLEFKYVPGVFFCSFGLLAFSKSLLNGVCLSQNMILVETTFSTTVHWQGMLMEALRHFGFFSINQKNFSLMLAMAPLTGPAKVSVFHTNPSFKWGVLIEFFNLNRDMSSKIFLFFLSATASISALTWTILFPLFPEWQLNFCISAWVLKTLWLFLKRPVMFPTELQDLWKCGKHATKEIYKSVVFLEYSGKKLWCPRG